MNNLNKTCVICGNKYSYCPSCGKDRNKPFWMSSFCSENCKNIYEVVARYGMNKIHGDEAIEILNTCDLSSKEYFTTSTQRLIDEIYEAPTKDVCTEALSYSETEFKAPDGVNNDGIEVYTTEEETSVAEPEIAQDNVGVTSAHISARKMNYKKKKKNRQ